MESDFEDNIKIIYYIKNKPKNHIYQQYFNLILQQLDSRYKIPSLQVLPKNPNIYLLARDLVNLNMNKIYSINRDIKSKQMLVRRINMRWESILD